MRDAVYSEMKDKHIVPLPFVRNSQVASYKNSVTRTIQQIEKADKTYQYSQGQKIEELSELFKEVYAFCLRENIPFFEEKFDKQFDLAFNGLNADKVFEKLVNEAQEQTEIIKLSQQLNNAKARAKYAEMKRFEAVKDIKSFEEIYERYTAHLKESQKNNTQPDMKYLMALDNRRDELVRKNPIKNPQFNFPIQATFSPKAKTRENEIKSAIEFATAVYRDPGYTTDRTKVKLDRLNADLSRLYRLGIKDGPYVEFIMARMTEIETHLGQLPTIAEKAKQLEESAKKDAEGTEKYWKDIKEAKENERIDMEEMKRNEDMEYGYHM